MINEYINIFDVGFEGIKNLLDNIFGLNLQNNKELKDFINKRSYALIAGLVCSSFTNEYNESYDEEYPDYTPEDFTKNNITNINTQQFVKLLNYKEDSMVSGKDMLISSKDIPDVFDDEEVFIKLCYTALSRVIHNIKYGECKKIHEELFEEELELESESELEQPVLASLNLPHNASTDQIQGNRQIQGNSKDFFPIIQ